MSREEALKLLQEKIKNKNLIKHSLAVEACMKALASHLKEDKERWGGSGLLHDIDYEETKNNPQEHSLKAAKKLEELGFEKEIVEAVKTHNEIHGIRPESKMAKSLFSVDPLTGLIVAATLVSPDKKLSSVSSKNVLNRFREKSFAKGADREIIKKCRDIGIDLKNFIEICLLAMQGIAGDLGL
ncbi:MAG: HDIG domain-containing metalloprotein [Patescibacteria group bacterium]